MQPQVLPNLKEKVDCPCGCGAYGTPLKKTGHVARLCPAQGFCPSCQGRKNKTGGHKKQRAARRALGVPDAKHVSALTNEEHWAGTVRVEVKSGAQVGPAWTRYLSDENQSEASRAVGDPRPFVDVLMAKDSSDGLVQFRLSKVREVVEALYEQLFLGGAA